MRNQLFNRKVFFSLLAVVMFLGLTAMSYGQAVVSVEPAEVESPAAGEELMVSINISGGADVAGYQLTVNFDPTALSYVSGGNADYLAGAVPVPPIVSDNSVGLAAVAIGAVSDGDGTLATVTFAVVEAKASAISLTDVIIAGADGALDVTTADGMVTVAAAEEVTEETTEETTEEVTEETTEETTEEVTEETTEETTAEEVTEETTEETTEEVTEETTEETTEEVTEETTEETTEEVTEETTEETTEEVTEETTEEVKETTEETTEEVTEETTEEVTEVEMPVSQMFEITLTNLTMGEPGMGGQVLSPPIFVTHAAGINLAPVGEAASPALVALAEGGDASGLVLLATAAGANSMVADGVLPPGGSLTVTVTADMVNSSLSVGSMLVSTNDAFIAATDVALFDEDGAPVSASLDLMSYDAGSEDNTEMASDIPGPVGLDAAVDPEGSNERVPTEGGVIAPHEGIQGIGDVGEAFAWAEPTAMLTITPVEAPAEPVVEVPVVEEPVVEEPVAPIVPGFDVTLEAGLNMISIPLMPAEPYTAKSLAEMVGATVVIQLNAATQSFVGYTVADSSDGFSIDGGQGYIVNTPAGGMVKFTGDAWDNQPEPEEPAAEEAPAEAVVEEPAAEEAPVEAVVEEPAAEEAPAEAVAAEEPAAEEAPAEAVAAEEPAAEEVATEAVVEEPAAEEAPVEAVVEEPAAEEAPAEAVAAEEPAAEEAPVEAVVEEPAAEEAPAAPALSTFKSAWAFIVTSDVRGMEIGTAYRLVAENLRTRTIATESITSDVRRSSAVWADLNRKSVIEAGDKLEIALYDQSGRVVSGPFQRTVSTLDIRNAFLSIELTVGDVQPQETILAQNFPNPFNPETWIPYQLNKATEVSVQIFDVSGRLVRTLNLGWQPVGTYMTPSSAAYWDGRNVVGERVASGIYFYTLQTSDFAATRRMVILK